MVLGGEESSQLQVGVAPGMLDKGVSRHTLRMRALGCVLGIVGAIATYLLMPAAAPAGAPSNYAPGAARGVAATVVLMACWWAFQVLPVAATALLPIALFPILGVCDVSQATAPYANKVIFLFLGGFMLALAMQRWNLHRRLALAIVLIFGTRPTRLVLGFMVATALLSMWVSNTATAVMMLPIGMSVLQLIARRNGKDAASRGFATALMLGIAYAASIGSLGTIIGTPPNALLVGFLASTYSIQIGFGQWMAMALPLAAVFLFIAWLVLTRAIFRLPSQPIEGGRELIRGELNAMGPMTAPEKAVLVVFAAAAVSWIAVPLLWPGSPVTDEVIAVLAALALFIIPARPRRGVGLLDWDTALTLPWGVLLLFGGGLSLAAQITDSGLAELLGSALAGLGGLPMPMFVALVALIVVFVTEVTSNTAAAATFLPLLASVAVGLGTSPLTLAIPVALAATCAFMLPVATPPNAVAFASGQVDVREMMRSGIWLNLISVLLITATAYTTMAWVFRLT